MKSHVQRRSGFTLAEVTVACWLTTLLAVMLSTTWVLLMPTTADLIVWGQLFQEMDIAVASLSRDLGGSLSDYTDTNDQLGEKRQGLLAECKPSTDGSQLLLCFDGGDTPDGIADWGSTTADWGSSTDDRIVIYSVDSTKNSLIRSVGAGTPFTVANNVSSLSVTSSETNFLQIVLTFSCAVKATGKTLTRSCTLIVPKHP